MVKLWAHRKGGEAPFLLLEITLAECLRQYDLENAEFLQPLGEHPPSPQAPGPLGDDPDSQLVVFEVLADEPSEKVGPGYYASHMSADTVQELLAEE